MGFVRYIFLLLVITGSTSIGFLLSSSLTNRVKELYTFLNLINILQNKIKFTHKTIAEILEEISNIEQQNEITKIFLKSSCNLKEQKIEEAWNNALIEERCLLNLKNEDIDIIRLLGNVLGKTDVEGQMSEIEGFKEMLKNQIRQAELEQKKNSKMYKSLGAIIGLTIAILLF